MFIKMATFKATTWRAQRPRYDRERGQNKINDHMPSCTMSKQTGSSRTGHVKEDAGIRPFFESWKTGHQYGNCSKYLPKSDNGREIYRISKLNESFNISRHACQLGHAPGTDEEPDHSRDYPITY